METVYKGITRIRFSGRESRIVSNSAKRPDLGLLVGLEACTPTYWGVWGAETPRKKASHILHVSVGLHEIPDSTTPTVGL